MQLRAALASALDDDDMAASSAAEQQPQLSLSSPEAASAKNGVNVRSTGSSAQPSDPAATNSNGPTEQAAGVEQKQDNGSAAIQPAAAGDAVPMDISRSAEELTLAVQVSDTLHCIDLRSTKLHTRFVRSACKAAADLAMAAEGWSL